MTLNFHPDRLARGQPILDQLAADGRYCSQFVTGTSNGGLTAHPGGDRWHWESRIFGGAYDEAPAHDRPVYGALIGLAEADHRDVLDDYIEAQVHGPVRLSADVAALVLDPSYRGTTVDASARRLPCPVEWHGGFRLAVAEMRRHPDYRGQEYVDLGAEIAVAVTSIPGSSAKRHARVAMTRRHSRRSGTTWPVSAHRFAMD